MALQRACQWDQPSTTFGLAQADPPHLRTQAMEQDPEPPLPFGWEKCFDLKTGVIFFKNTSTGIRTATDPRVEVKLQQQYHQQKKDVDCEAWRGLSRSIDTADLGCAGDKGMNHWTDRFQNFRGLEASTIDEKVSKWSQNYSSKKLPPLLSSKSTDSLPSLDLSLRVEGPHARDSSSLQLSTSGNKPGSFNGMAGQVKLEQLEQCRQDFFRPNHNMGPFPGNSMKVKEESTSETSQWEVQSPVVCNLSSSTFPIFNASREGTETATTSAPEQPQFRDLLGPRYAMGPFSSSAEQGLAESMPSSMAQLAGTCTLDKVLRALERTQCQHEAAKNNSASKKTGTQNGNSLRPSPFHLQPSPAKMSSAAASLSPTSSDESAVSSKSSLVSSTTPSVMSFQGEELDNLGGQSLSAEAKTRSSGLSTSVFADPKVEDGAEAPITLVAVGCMSCHMFFMLSKDKPSCPKCGQTGLLDISPPRKRQREESSPVDAESRRLRTSSSPF